MIHLFNILVTFIVFVIGIKTGVIFERGKWIYCEYFLNNKNIPMKIDKKTGTVKPLKF